MRTNDKKPQEATRMEQFDQTTSKKKPPEVGGKVYQQGYNNGAFVKR